MIGIILAAGVGSRLRPLTHNIPKCLIKVSGKEILKYQIEAYSKSNIKNLIIVSGYLHEEIESFIKIENFENIKIEILHNNIFEITNNMYSLWLALHYVEGGFIFSNGDVIFDPSILNSLMISKEDNLIAVDVGENRPENMKVTIKDGYIDSINKNISEKESFGTSIDIYKIGPKSKSILFDLITRKYIENNIIDQWTEVALQDLLSIVKVLPLDIMHKKWMEIDTFADLEAAQYLFKD